MSALTRQISSPKSLIFIAAAGGDDLWTEHLGGLRIELALAVHHGAEHGQAAPVAVVQDLDDFRALVAEAKVGLSGGRGA